MLLAPQAPGVLITRPTPGLEETAQRVVLQGWVPFEAPMLKVRCLPLRSSASADVRAIILTSRQAVAPARGLVKGGGRDIPVFTVGNATGEHARKSGFERVVSADGDGGALVELLLNSLGRDERKILFPCGRGHGTGVVASLRQAGFRVERRCVYETVPVRKMPYSVLNAFSDGRIGVAMFYSAQSARAFVRAYPTAAADSLAKVTAITISAAVSNEINSLTWREVLQAPRPNGEAMLKLLGHHRHD